MLPHKLTFSILYHDHDPNNLQRGIKSWEVCSCSWANQIRKDMSELTPLDTADVENTKRIFKETFIRRQELWSSMDISDEEKSMRIINRMYSIDICIAKLKADKHAAFIVLDEIKRRTDDELRKKIKAKDKEYKVQEEIQGAEVRKEKLSEVEKLIRSMMKSLSLSREAAEEFVLKNKV